MTHAITTLDDRELDAVYGGFTLNIGSFNWTKNWASQSSSVSAGGGGNTISVTQGISQQAIVGSVVLPL
jgi:hypothetical protein